MKTYVDGQFFGCLAWVDAPWANEYRIIVLKTAIMNYIHHGHRVAIL